MSYINRRELAALHETIRALREYPFRVNYRGVEVRCQTAEDALSLTGRLKALRRKIPLVECETLDQALELSGAIRSRGSRASLAGIPTARPE